jgi:hypothetical protein
MRFDRADWKQARDALFVRLGNGAWRHGLKTWDAVKEMARYGRFPADPSTTWAPKYRKKHGEILDQSLYDFVQSGLKNRRWVLADAHQEP